MYDVNFDIDAMYIINKDCSSAENKLKGSVSGLVDLSNLLSSEISSFSSYSHLEVDKFDAKILRVNRMIDEVERKKSSAKGQKKQEQSPPTPPSIPSKATPEEQSKIMKSYASRVAQVEKANAEIRKNNAHIDEYASKCESTVARLREIVSELKGIASHAVYEMDCTLSNANDSLNAIHNSTAVLSSVENNMVGFTRCFNNVYNDAFDLATMNCSDIEPSNYGYRTIEIKNRYRSGFGGGSYFSHSGGASKTTDTFRENSISENFVNDSCDEELLIEDRDICSFLEKLANARKIKMPAANFHKLGGPSFVAKMKEQGYALHSKGGRVIDDNGMMHWRRENNE